MSAAGWVKGPPGEGPCYAALAPEDRVFDLDQRPIPVVVRGRSVYLDLIRVEFFGYLEEDRLRRALWHPRTVPGDPFGGGG